MMKLEDKTDASVSKLRQLRASKAGDIPASVEDSPPGGQIERADQVEQSALAGARRADDRDHLSAIDLEIDTLEDFE
jgi:hypothetical protein